MNFVISSLVYKVNTGAEVFLFKFLVMTLLRIANASEDIIGGVVLSFATIFDLFLL